MNSNVVKRCADACESTFKLTDVTKPASLVIELPDLGLHDEDDFHEALVRELSGRHPTCLFTVHVKGNGLLSVTRKPIQFL